MDVNGAVIYTRMSRVHQGREWSVEDQERECRVECERKGWPVREVFCDKDIGASRHSGKERPEWERLKAAIRPGDIVVMWEGSRSTRDLAEFVTLRALCEDLGVPLSYGGKQLDMAEAEDRFSGGLDALLAEREAEMIRNRALRGKRSSAAAGRPYGPAPWGLRRADTVEVKWELDPVEAPRLRGAMDRALAGQSLRSILKWLESTGRTFSGVTNLRRALCNPAVAGLRVHQVLKGNVETTPAQWPAIVTREEQLRLAAHSKRNPEPRGQEPLHLLSGIAVCGVCDAPLGHKRKPRRSDYYRCPNGHVARSAMMIDGLAIAELVKGYADEQPPADDAEAQDARNAIARIEDQLAEYETKAINEEISATAFSRIEAGFLARIAALRPLTLKAVPSPFEHMKISTEEFMAASMSERREMIRARLTVTVNSVPSRRKGLPEDVVVKRK